MRVDPSTSRRCSRSPPCGRATSAKVSTSRCLYGPASCITVSGRSPLKNGSTSPPSRYAQEKFAPSPCCQGREWKRRECTATKRKQRDKREGDREGTRKCMRERSGSTGGTRSESRGLERKSKVMTRVMIRVMTRWGVALSKQERQALSAHEAWQVLVLLCPIVHFLFLSLGRRRWPADDPSLHRVLCSSFRSVDFCLAPACGARDGG